MLGGGCVVLLAAACATAEKMNEARDSWQGASYEEVLRAWGAPARSTKTPDGRDWHTWVTESLSPAELERRLRASAAWSVGGGSGVGRRESAWACRSARHPRPSAASEP